ncbi:DUF1365 domain-containing protein [Pseudomonas mangrovi]|uniref:DUF1365 domain-containing protein n=1 Tax=Pseudomonas mangrovi TaxID=2161748 RepID=A0A2T5PD71_9PSED|nr:DUF1365 domain-containing protein [Pseudomonas mangrovi]PTU75681.1 DUF1365 domain-containing protein [Pseudomonas mangrovi]
MSGEIRHSALYSGWVQHRRFAPRVHAFRYRMGLLYLDLDEQQALFALSPLAGNGRWQPFAFRETDYLPDYTSAGVRLVDAVRARVGEILGETFDGPVRLLTQARSWGLSFNPVSFFYCFDRDEQLRAVLCEVSNTPWRQRYHYVLPVTAELPQRFALAKQFHVSPFLPLDLEYRMRLGPPGERLTVQMEDWQGETRLFQAGLALQREALTRASLHRQLLRFPWMTGKTLAAIYWQALRLAIKRIPLFNHQPSRGPYGLATPSPQERSHEEH